jgi:hypothetical protein
VGGDAGADACKKGEETPVHPFSLPKTAWPSFLESLGAKPSTLQLREELDTCTNHLPSTLEAPMPSPQLANYSLAAVDEANVALLPWRVDCQRLDHPVWQFRELHFLAFCQTEGVQPGSDFLFWYWFTQELKRLLVRDQYLPALIPHQTPQAQGQAHTAAARALWHLAMGLWPLRTAHRRCPRADASRLCLRTGRPGGR